MAEHGSIEASGDEIIAMPMPLKQIAGQRHGRLMAIEYDSAQKKWRCQCACGTIKYVTGSRFRQVKSCGCWNIEAIVERNHKHGDSKRGAIAPEYRVWAGRIKRCTDENNKSFSYYGGRGIGVCARWRHGEDGASGYECFLADMGRKPSPKHSIDRINNDGGYEPSNCRWATHTQQMLNRRGWSKCA